MILLKNCERIQVVAEEKDIMSGKKNIMIMFQNRLYSTEGTFKCISDPTQKNLYSHLKSEFTQAKDEVEKAYGNFEKMISKAPEPAPAPVQTGVGSKLEEILCNVIAEQSVDKIIETAKPILEKHIIETFGVLPQKHEVVTPAGKHEFEGVTHEQFDKVLNLVNLDIPVFLSGAAGTGKNVICKQVSQALNLEFYFTNAVTQEYQLKGFIDANGTYHETQFYKAFTEGGLFFLDEMDGSIPETLIILNAAIANKYFDFPTGRFEAHKDFRVIAAGNTIGTGADIEYTGRFQLDASSLDRFALIQIDYSPAIEKAVTNNNEELCKFARKFREVTEQCGIRCLFTYRSLERITKLEGTFELSEIIQLSLTKGLGKDDLKIISGKFNGMNNKYLDAMKKLL